MKKIINVASQIIILFVMQSIIELMAYGGIKLFSNLFSTDSKMHSLLTNENFLNLACSIVFILVLIWYFKSAKKTFFQRLSFKPITFNKAVYIIIFSIGISVFDNLFVNVVGDFFPSYNEVMKRFSHKSILLAIDIIIIAPIIEEFLFRGLIFNMLRKEFKLVTAIIVQALIFGICHGNLLQGIYTFVSGIILALVYLYVESIYASILMHMTFNALGAFVFPYIIPLLANFINNTLLVVLFILFGVICLIFGGLHIFNFNKNNAKNKFLVKL